MEEINTLIVEGTFAYQLEEIATFIDTLNKKTEEDSFVAALESISIDNNKDLCLEMLVNRSNALSKCNEKDYKAACNLFIHLIRESSSIERLLPTVLSNLVIPNFPNGPLYFLSVLSTLFNILPFNSILKYDVFCMILRVASEQKLFDFVLSQINDISDWLDDWGVDSQAKRDLFLIISKYALEYDKQMSLDFIIKALLTYPSSEALSASDLARQAIISSVSLPKRYHFDDIVTLDALQPLRDINDPSILLLEIFMVGGLKDYLSFIDTHQHWVDNSGLDQKIALKKIHHLTLVSLAASVPGKVLSYADIADALDVDISQVEMWVIDVIRMGLLEGRLSQLSKTFLIHRNTYRVWGKEQWIDLKSKLCSWETNLEGVLKVIKQHKTKVNTVEDELAYLTSSVGIDV
ncbi:uncharacterized protein T551_00514 [Pneumocystis jirovecii RU7]|uniref:Eukaryotic translation initiation factor 3 subunit M n=1 Tax=Pneumocystis jirovecii (strain RU7) TaxID=1408657 RepID=A0A0W4ZVN6_PNEJ7|nr:uncharacterized protein T551_00514 [Pneumocystis jirovecii RU7]KTW32424.1 hypothetical protein T551_00514 [Pneumocystis jirovecii RU7]